MARPGTQYRRDVDALHDKIMARTRARAALERLAAQGYVCSVCQLPADQCGCPWEEHRSGIERKPPLVLPGGRPPSAA